MVEHAGLSASSAYRWRSCPGSIRECAGIEAPPSMYADAGTAVHAAAKVALEDGLEARALIGRKFEGHTIDHEMVDAIDLYLEVIRAREPDDLLLLEKRVDLEPWDPPVPMFGTSDAIIYQPTSRRLV